MLDFNDCISGTRDPALDKYHVLVGKDLQYHQIPDRFTLITHPARHSNSLDHALRIGGLAD